MRGFRRQRLSVRGSLSGFVSSKVKLDQLKPSFAPLSVILRISNATSQAPSDPVEGLPVRPVSRPRFEVIGRREPIFRQIPT